MGWLISCYFWLKIRQGRRNDRRGVRRCSLEQLLADSDFLLPPVPLQNGHVSSHQCGTNRPDEVRCPAHQRLPKIGGQ